MKVLTFAKKETVKEFPRAYSLNPEIKISLIIMRVAARMFISCIILFETKLNSAQVTNNLSAIGSKIFPYLDDWLNDLAR